MPGTGGGAAAWAAGSSLVLCSLSLPLSLSPPHPQNGNTALAIAKRLGYISVVDTLKVVTEEVTTTTVSAAPASAPQAKFWRCSHTSSSQSVRALVLDFGRVSRTTPTEAPRGRRAGVALSLVVSPPQRVSECDRRMLGPFLGGGGDPPLCSPAFVLALA